MLTALVLCPVWRCGGLSRKGESSIVGNCPEAAYNNRPFKSYRFFDLHSKTNPIILLSA